MTIAGVVFVLMFGVALWVGLKPVMALFVAAMIYGLLRVVTEDKWDKGGKSEAFKAWNDEPKNTDDERDNARFLAAYGDTFRAVAVYEHEGKGHPCRSCKPGSFLAAIREKAKREESGI